MQRNRDWDRDWFQGNGRSAHDYGRTVLYREPEPSRWGWWIAGLLVVGAFLWIVL